MSASATATALEGLRDRLHDVDSRVSTHEAVCAYRYGNIDKRVARIEKLVWAVLAQVAFGAVYVLRDHLLHLMNTL